jgi:hypothetical protein
VTGHPTNPAVTGGGDGGPEWAPADALFGLAREVEALRRTVDPLRDAHAGLDAKHEELVGVVGQLTDYVTALTARPGPAPSPSWLLAPTDPDTVERMLAELRAWLYAVFLRYPDGASALPECWLYHPDVVEELTWLMHAWCLANQGKTASVQSAGDWHDRQRPGVVRRIRDGAGSCSIERHQTRPDRDQYPAGAVPVSGITDPAVIARWWATRRDDPAPEPAPPAPAGVAAVLNAAWRR